MCTQSIEHEVILNFICTELHLPVYGFFNLAYAYKYRKLENQWHDVGEYKRTRIIPDYVLEFMYDLIEEEQAETEKSDTDDSPSEA